MGQFSIGGLIIDRNRTISGTAGVGNLGDLHAIANNLRNLQSA